MSNKVALVAVCHNHLDVTKKFVESVMSELDSNYELHLLDNGSSDDTWEYLCSLNNKDNRSENKPLVLAYKSDINKGFAGGNNEILRILLKIEQAKPTYTNIILINNDTLITKKAIEELVKGCNSSQEIGATGPLSNNVGGIQLAKRFYKIADNEYKKVADNETLKANNVLEAGMLVGFCLCLKTKVVKEIGLLDEQFGFGMWEDNDYCLRIRNAGYKLAIVNNSFVYHYGSQTIQDFGANELFEENRIKFLNKYKTSKYQKIVALCRVKNGGEIFRKCLLKVSSMVDEVLVFDDNSTDNTADIAKKFANVVYYKSEWTTLDEARDRQWMLEKAREMKADWCWIFDHDEMPSDRLARDLRYIIENASPEKDLLCFKRDEYWDNDKQVRVDGVWGTFWQGRLFRLRKQFAVISNATKGDANFHCSAHGPIPIQCIEYLPYTIWHYGNMTVQERLRKYLWYTKSDKVKNLKLVMGTYQKYYMDLYAQDAVNKGEINNIEEYQLKPTDAYRHIVSPLGQKLIPKQEPKIALSMIVKNEAKYIRKCLESVKGLVDEIVIVDTGSTDSTKAICKQYTNNIYDFKWNDNFSDARNFALSKVSKNCNWILRLDGDEVVPQQSIMQIYNAVDNDEADVFIFPIINILQLKPLKHVLSKTARLFKNIEGIKYNGIVHEEIDDSVRELGLKVSNFNGNILHYGYLKNKDTLGDKFKFYERLALKEIEKDPNNFKPYYTLAAHYCYLKDYDKAIAMYEKALAINDKSYMIWHDYGVAKFYKMLKDNQTEIKEMYNIFAKAMALIPKNEFGEYRRKLDFNFNKVKGMIL